MVLYPMNEMLAHIESRYLLVNMVAHRARELSLIHILNQISVAIDGPSGAGKSTLARQAAQADVYKRQVWRCKEPGCWAP